MAEAWIDSPPQPRSQEQLALARPPALPSLTALRFFAAMAILVHHCNGVFWPVAELGPLDAGVSFFFVLSGFILTHVYGARLTSRTELRRYLVARIARIWPLHLLCLALTLLLITVPEPFRPGALAANALMLHAWIPFDRYFFSYNYVSWSISTELFFYLVFPLLVQRSRAGLLWLLLAALAGVATLAVVSYEDALPTWDLAYDRLSSTGLMYTNPLARIAEFMAGIVAARCMVRGRAASMPTASAQVVSAQAAVARAAPSWRWTVFEMASIALFLAGFRYFRFGAAYFTQEVMALVTASGLPAIPGVPPGPAVAAIGTEWLSHVGLAPFAMLVILVFAQQRGGLSALLLQRWLVFLGEASFALYLVHQIGLRLLQQHGLAPPPGTLFRGPAFAAYVGAMLAIAIALHLAVERPMRNWITRRSCGPARSG